MVDLLNSWWNRGGSFESAIEAHHLGTSVEQVDVVVVVATDAVVVAYVITTGDVVYVVTTTAFVKRS